MRKIKAQYNLECFFFPIQIFGNIQLGIQFRLTAVRKKLLKGIFDPSGRHAEKLRREVAKNQNGFSNKYSIPDY